MCGRYQLALPGQTLASMFDAKLGAFGAQGPTWNAAPTQVLPVLLGAGAANGGRRIVPATWGLTPGWARQPGREIRPLINARSETALEKPAFRRAIRHGRIAVPTTGFYEWSGARGAKVPWLIRTVGEAVDVDTGELLGRHAEPGEVSVPFLVAGISETWIDEHDQPHLSYAVMTTTPNEVCAPIHDRMPVILEGDAIEAWLHTPPEETELLTELLRPLAADRMEAWAVPPFVNDVSRNGPELVLPDAPTALF